MSDDNQLSRRSFIKLATLFSGSLFLGTLWFRWDFLYDSYQQFLTSQVSKGPLSEKTLNFLLAVSGALLNADFDESHYEDFFQYRSRELDHYKAVYLNFERVVQDLSSEEYNARFEELSTVRQREILLERMKLRDLHEKSPEFGLKTRANFNQWICEEIYSLYAEFEVWKELGYDAVPSRADGLEVYTQFPGVKGS